MLQLADVYVWLQQLCVGPRSDEYPRSELIEFVRTDTKLLWATKYKEWPTDGSWIQVQQD
jgi:hypothetical protein